MLHEEKASSVIRFFKEGSTYGDDYAAVLSVVYLNSKTVMLHSFSGTLNRTMFRELIQWLMANGIEDIFANRNPKRRLPLATMTAQGLYHMRVAELAERLIKNEYA